MSVLVKVFKKAPPAVRAELSRLVKGTERERIEAVHAIVRMDYNPAAPVLLDRLLNETAPVTEALLKGLHALDPESAHEGAHHLAAYGSAPCGAVARAFLSSIPHCTKPPEPAPLAGAVPLPNTVPELLACLKDQDAAVRKAAIERLRGFSDKRIVPALLAHRNDRSAEVVRSLLKALRRAAPEEALDAAVGIVHRGRHPDVGADFLAHEDPDKLLDLAASRDSGVGATAARALAGLGLTVALDRCQSRLRNNANHAQRERAVSAIARVARCEVEEPAERREERRRCCLSLLIPVLHDPSDKVRRTALWGLKDNDWPAWVDEAKRMLKDPSGLVRRQALRSLGEHGDAANLDAILEMLEDADRYVRERAIEAAEAVTPDREVILNAIRQTLGHESGGVRQHGVQWLGERGGPSDLAEAAKALRDGDVDVRLAALTAIQHLAQSAGQVLVHARRALGDDHWKMRRLAVEVFGKRGSEKDVDSVVERFQDPDDDVRTAALEAARRLSPGRAAEFAERMLTDGDEKVAQAALEILTREADTNVIVRIALSNIKRARGDSGPLLFEAVEKRAPERVPEVIGLAAKARSEALRAKAAEMLPVVAPQNCVSPLKQLLRDRDGGVRLAAFRSLHKAVPEESRRMALEALHDRDWEVRLEGLKALAREDSPLLVYELLPLARDEDRDVRLQAITVLAKFDDLRVFSELVSSVNDVDEKVQRRAKRILAGKHGPVPVLHRIASALGEDAGEPLWSRIREYVDGINRWASRIGQELLGRPVVVHNYRQGLGQTRARGRRTVAQIEVSDTPVTSGHPHGEDIMRGLALHEIGHHLCDYGQRGHYATRGIARSEGVGEIYDILTDERLERILRSRRPEWGVYFDRIASYAFAQNVSQVPIEEYAAMVERTPEATLEAVRRGELPGRILPLSKTGGKQRVALLDRDMLAVPSAIPPFGAFTACLRCGFDPRMHPDPKVAQAIALVPDNLKDCTHGDVLEVSRRIADVIGRSKDHKRNMAELQRWMRERREAWRVLLKMFDRLADTGHLPDWMRREAQGIRRNRLVIVTRPPRRGGGGLPGQVLNLGPQRDFPPLTREENVPYDPARHAKTVAAIRKHIRRLRWYLERLGTRTVDEYAVRRGRRLDLAQVRKAVLTRSPDLLVFSRDESLPDAYLGILIDRSGSMGGEKIERAKAFGVLLAESARGLKGIEGHVNAFDGDTFYLLGRFARNAVASLTADDGNNDAAALARAAELALRSRKRNRLLVMISDGSPSECSVESLKALVTRLSEQYGIVCAQVAVDKMEEIAFPHYVDVSKYPTDEAVARFGRLLVDLTKSWR